MYLLGLAAIFIASKYIEIVPLNLEIVRKNLGHNRFSLREIREMEVKVLRVIKFGISPKSLYNEAARCLK